MMFPRLVSQDQLEVQQERIHIAVPEDETHSSRDER